MKYPTVAVAMVLSLGCYGGPNRGSDGVSGGKGPSRYEQACSPAIDASPPPPPAVTSPLGDNVAPDRPPEEDADTSNPDAGTGDTGEGPLACPDYAYLTYHQCLDKGGTSNACEREFEDAFMTQCTGDPVTVCARQCTRTEEQSFDTCVAGGRPEDECREEQEAALDECVAGCRTTTLESTSLGSGDADERIHERCSPRCEEHAYQAYLACLGDATKDDCEHVFGIAFDGCLAGCTLTPHAGVYED